MYLNLFSVRALRPRRLLLVLAVLVAASAALALAQPQQSPAAVGNCTPDAAWGTSNAAFANQVITLVNQHRQSLGLATLGVSPTLTASATWKSAHMAFYGYLQHDDPAPPIARTVSDRLGACGYPIGRVGWGENIAFGYQTPQDVMNAWLNSPGHKANIENATYRAIGVAAVARSNGTYYWTQDFGTLLDSGSAPPAPPPPPSPAPAAPTVSLTSGPAASTTSSSATFAWSTTGSPTSVTCSLDGATATACTSPRSYSGLATGTHRFVVTVGNASGSTSASYSWTIASSTPVAAAPTVKLTSAPSGFVSARSATFTWQTTGSPTTVTCSLDGAPAAACASGLTYTGLAAGQHTFAVTAANAAGSATVSDRWWILG